VIIEPVDQTTINGLIDWLKSIALIKDNLYNLSSKLPKICKDGVIFVDLINRYNFLNNFQK